MLGTGEEALPSVTDENHQLYHGRRVPLERLNGVPSYCTCRGLTELESLRPHMLFAYVERRLIPSFLGLSLLSNCPTHDCDGKVWSDTTYSNHIRFACVCPFHSCLPLSMGMPANVCSFRHGMLLSLTYDIFISACSFRSRCCFLLYESPHYETNRLYYSKAIHSTDYLT